MSQVDEIRQEQEQEMHEHHTPMHRLVQCFSNIFHPLLVLTYSAIVLCLFTPMMMLPFSIKAFFVGEVFFYTMLMPALAITLMHIFHIIGHWALRDRRDRMLPFFTNFVCYAINAFVLTRNGFLPIWVLMPYYGAVILTFVAWIVSFWWKISAHASADAAGATLFLLLAYYFPATMPLWLALGSVVIVGGICSSRVYLGRHTLAQVGSGVLLGIISLLLADAIFLR